MIRALQKQRGRQSSACRRILRMLAASQACYFRGSYVVTNEISDPKNHDIFYLVMIEGIADD
jgi:hypothetical protein